jgi:hypothetical protein
MADAAGKKPTHTAFALKRSGRRQQFRQWLEIGIGWQRENGSFQANLDRTPLGGWTGFIHFEPAGRGPPPLPPERPAANEHDEPDETA